MRPGERAKRKARSCKQIRLLEQIASPTMNAAGREKEMAMLRHRAIFNFLQHANLRFLTLNRNGVITTLYAVGRTTTELQEDIDRICATLNPALARQRERRERHQRLQDMTQNYFLGETP
jgi:hypothetical protein